MQSRVCYYYKKKRAGKGGRYGQYWVRVAVEATAGGRQAQASGLVIICIDL